MTSTSLWQAGASLTIYEIAGLEESSPVVSDLARSWTIDLSAIEAIDGAGVQWLLLCRERARRIGGDVILAETSPAATEALALCGALAGFRPAQGEAEQEEDA